MKKKKRIVLLDTSAIIRGNLYFLKQFGELYTIPEVLMEIKDEDSLFKINFEEIKVDRPSESSINKIKEIVKKSGEILSKTDIKLLAMAETFLRRDENNEITIATDDYSIQNIAKKLKYNFISISTEGIKEERDYLKKCIKCLMIYEPNLPFCPRCNEEVFKKIVKKQKKRKSKGLS